ncbi:M23 family metallopeptidase [Calderihabitans maritimus]|uniref:Peptidase M23B n=1 Tax=Calderihabitans maritimus TaxID=1246530 RepID=A0A1Z5HX07_9FIRM|nr:M23 family metallopeptidase [Calderihabitans maritimus]GAW93845.1 peptidase M23B [Calderihabitans maritimus]
MVKNTLARVVKFLRHNLRHNWYYITLTLIVVLFVSFFQKPLPQSRELSPAGGKIVPRLPFPYQLIERSPASTGDKGHELTGKQSDGEKKREGERPEKGAEMGTMQIPVSGEAANPFGFTYSATFADFRFHPGIDWLAAVNAPVKAVLDGRVVRVEYNKMDAYRITLDHGAGWKTRYLHLGQVQVEKGQKVKRGEVIGKVGKPGLAETVLPPHLHFELLYQGEPRDPARYFKEK